MMRGDFWRRLRLPWSSSEQLGDEVDDEIRLHLELRAEELVAQGVSPEEARVLAARTFGDARTTRARYVSTRAKTLRRARARLWLDDLRQDLAFALRSLGRQRGFTAVAVLIVTLGIGAPATVLTLIDGIFFERPAHVAEPHRLVRIFPLRGPDHGVGRLTNADYLYYREHATTLSGIAAWGDPSEVAYRIADGETDQLTLGFVSDNYFDVLGTRPSMGRAFRPEENAAPGAGPVVVLSHGFWTRALGASPEAIGTTVSLNGVTFTVIGIAPERFTGISPAERSPDAWVPIAMYGALTRPGDDAWWRRQPHIISTWLSAVGRLADGATVEAAEENLVALSAAMEYEDKDPDLSSMVTRQYLYGPATAERMTSLVTMLLAVAGMVLLIATANIAVLLLARATTRSREMGIRAAMGARSGRLVRQLVTEGLLLGLLGGACGVAVAYLSAGLAGSLLPISLTVTFTPSGRVLAACLTLALTTSLLSGLAPGLHGARTDVRGVIQHASPPSGDSRLRSALVVSQLGLSVVLVAGAVLFGRSFLAAQQRELGFRTDSILVIGTQLAGLGYDEVTGRVLVEDALQRIQGVPGVRDATTARMIPFHGEWSSDVDPPAGSPEGAAMIRVGVNAVSPGYFDLLGIRMVEGRPIGPEDREATEPVAVVNESMARQFWPGRSPIGEELPIWTGVRVVGVASDATYYELGESGRNQAYVAEPQRYTPSVQFLVRTDGDAAALAPAVQSALREIEPSLTFNRVTTMTAVVDEQLARYRVSAILVSLFGLIALTLAAVGLYAVVSHLTAQRTREIGVRMALGATRRRVARHVLASGLKLAAVGVALGLLTAAALRNLTRSLVFGVAPEDPAPLVLACATLLAATVLASVAPALRAARVDPTDAMRAE